MTEGLELCAGWLCNWYAVFLVMQCFLLFSRRMYYNIIHVLTDNLESIGYSRSLNLLLPAIAALTCFMFRPSNDLLRPSNDLLRSFGVQMVADKR